MTHDELMAALSAWVEETLDEIEHVYPFVPARKPEKLPDCVIEVAFDRTEAAATDSDSYVAQLQQTYVRFRECRLSFMVDNANPEAAARQLGDFSDRLIAAIAQDGTLGGRVPFVSREIEFDNTSPFVEYTTDGTKGRETVLTINVGENLEVR